MKITQKELFEKIERLRLEAIRYKNTHLGKFYLNEALSEVEELIVSNATGELEIRSPA